MIKAAYFVANLVPVSKNAPEKTPGESLTFEAYQGQSFFSVAKAFAEKHGLLLSDQGRPEYSPRFKHVESFGVQGSTLRMFVWAGA